MLELQPITYKNACEFIKVHHSHHLPPQGWKYGIAVNDGRNIVGVIMVGRPVARLLDNGRTLEVTRCCTNGYKNAASKLYSAAWRVCKNLGYKRLITYTLASEFGTCLKASGWKILYQTRGGKWDRKNRPRFDLQPTCPKTLWEAPGQP